MDILLGQYKGLKATIPYIAYTDDDINSQIATLLSGNPIRESKKGPVEMGDTAVIDYDLRMMFRLMVEKPRNIRLVSDQEHLFRDLRNRSSECR